MPILLEVIVTSLHEAIEAQAGGADRLELVTALHQGGLTPDLELAQAILGKVSIPVRVMLRETASMSVSSAAEVTRLQARARELAALPIDGLVTGFLQGGTLDLDTLRQILAAVPETPVTFHRAFDLVRDRLEAIQLLKGMPQIDRLLTDGGEGSWDERRQCVSDWQRACAPEIQVIFATGKEVSRLPQLKRPPGPLEVHVGRAARLPHTTSGIVHREQVAALKRALT